MESRPSPAPNSGASGSICSGFTDSRFRVVTIIEATSSSRGDCVAAVAILAFMAGLEARLSNVLKEGGYYSHGSGLHLPMTSQENHANRSLDCDVIIIGGGPAGTTAAPNWPARAAKCS